MNSEWMSRKLFRKSTALMLALIMMLTLLAACSKGTNQSAENRVIRIGMLYGSASNEPYYRQQYTDMYEINHPNITFEFVNAINYDNWRFNQNEEDDPSKADPFEQMKAMLTGTNPVDIVMIDYNMLRRLTQDNLLLNLDPLVQQDKFDLSDYVPTVIDGIKQAGDNNLYALTPTFSASALFYNKKLFTDAGLDFPTDKMEWSQILDLARQLSKGEGVDRKFGFAFNSWGGSDGVYDAQTYAQTLQLKMWDDNGDKMLVNNDKWANAWETIAGLYRDKVLPDQEFMNLWYQRQYEDDGSGKRPYYGDLFTSGTVAMMINGSYYINELKTLQDNSANLEGEMVDWDVVTVPVHPEAPDIGGNIWFNQLMGINAKAQNPDDAWEFIKFTNSKEWAKLRARNTNELVARKEFLKPLAGMTYNIDAFTLLKPIPPSSTDTEKANREVPGIYEAQSPSYQLFQDVLAQKLSVKEALAQWETEGNAIIERLKSGVPNPDGGIGIPRPLDDTATIEALEEASGVAEEVVE